jgi:peptidoglycan hydrolase-like protein with peptidoglycan-binding domain
MAAYHGQWGYSSFGADPQPAPDVLRYGSKGPAVVELQKKLGVFPDGIFGDKTLRALQQAQLEAGQPTTGKASVPGGTPGGFPWLPVIIGVVGIGALVVLWQVSKPKRMALT